ncbi:ATP binding protein [Dorcoceras hygrometricum]|uniref:ATP binding protein n=1 Tax=Dorcoceras hygrometricum TaxID=472368 RepID=A0A2Z7CUU9_9LAMI|nr:ATP binding protein [Dorcoceras hygrometricum]
MVYEYKKLSQTFEDVKAENECLKDKSDDTNYLQLGDSDSLKTELSKLKMENESLRCLTSTSKNDRLNLVMSSWAKSSISLGKLHEVQKPFIDKTGLGFCSGESISSDTSTQSDLVDDKLKTVSFVKSSMIHDTLESVKYDDQNVSKLNQKGNFSIGYAEPDNSNPSWLKNRLDKDREKAGSQSSDLCTSKGVV